MRFQKVMPSRAMGALAAQRPRPASPSRSASAHGARGGPSKRSVSFKSRA